MKALYQIHEVTIEKIEELARNWSLIKAVSKKVKPEYEMCEAHTQSNPRWPGPECRKSNSPVAPPQKENIYKENGGTASEQRSAENHQPKHS